jgi:hypothetical protein
MSSIALSKIEVNPKTEFTNSPDLVVNGGIA